MAERIPTIRIAARAVVLDADDRILLVLFVQPETGAKWWATPGGALEPGETHEAALRRELLEETGISAPPGPCIWFREHVFEWGEHYLRQVERFYLVRVDSPEIAPQLSPEELAAEDLREIRWWTLGELESSREVFAPSRLAVLLRAMLEEGPPAEPIDAGV